MPVSRHGTLSRSSVTPRSPLAPISTAEQVSPAAPMSWIAMTQSFAMISRHASSSSFSENGSPDLHGRPLLLGALAEFGRRHAGAMDAVAAGLGAEIDDRHADAGRRRVENLVGVGQPHRHGVDQIVAVVARVKTHLPADRRHAKGVSVTADARHHARHQMARFRMLGIAEAQRIETRDRPRAHGEHVAQDAADAGGGALIGLDVARVVVALHLEHDGQAIADVDHAGVLARPLDHPRRLGRQPAQMHFRGFVRAVLVPHRREDAELGEARLAPDQVEDALVLVRLEAVLGDQFGSDVGFVADHCLKVYIIPRGRVSEHRVSDATVRGHDPDALHPSPFYGHPLPQADPVHLTPPA